MRLARWARSRIIRAERWGTARNPAAWSCSHRATVASMPLAGEAVTETVAPAGRYSAWSSAFFNGTSSKVGARRIPASAADRAGVSEDRRRKSTLDLRVRHRCLAPGDEVE